MITIEPDVAPAKASSPNRRRLYLMLALMGVAGAVFIAFACVWHNAALYRYAHVPYRSALVPRPYPQIGQSADGLAFSPNSKILAVADMQEGWSYWIVPQLRCDRRFDAPVGATSATAMIWTADGESLSLGDTEIVQWSYRGKFSLSVPGKFPKQLTNADIYSHIYAYGTGDGYRYHALSASGLLAAGAAPQGGFKVWNTKTGRQIFSVPNSACGRFGYLTDFCDIAFSPEESLISTTSVQGDDSVAIAPLDIVIREAKTGHVLRKWQWKQASLMKSSDSLGYTGLTFSPDGALLAIADNRKVSIWNAQSGVLMQTLIVTDPSIGDYIGRKRLVFFDKGRLLAGVGWGAAIPVWDTRTGALLQTFYGEKYMEALAASPDGRWLATGEQDNNNDGRLELWDVSRFLR